MSRITLAALSIVALAIVGLTLIANNASAGRVSTWQERPASPDGLWRETNETVLSSGTTKARIETNAYRVFRLNQEALSQLLAQAPAESANTARDEQVVMTLPMPDGTYARFRIEESPIMEPELAQKFPEIKTYRGQGIDDRTATTRFDRTPLGFHAVVLSTHGTVYVEPLVRGESVNHVAYYHRDVRADAFKGECLTSDAHVSDPTPTRMSRAAANVASGQTLRTYRLAVAVTAEYTQFYGGGTIAGAFSAMTTTINFVNAVFEREAAIRMVLVANETDVIFTDPATDGYTSDNARRQRRPCQKLGTKRRRACARGLRRRRAN